MILICDDDTTVLTSLSLVLKRAGYQTLSATTPRQALDQVEATCPELILMDMNYTHTTTGEEGLELLEKVKKRYPQIPVILITAWGSIGLAVKGIRAGAFDFITKPWNNTALLNSIHTALQINSETEADRQPEEMLPFDKIIGRSPQMQQVFHTVSKIAPTNAPVLITGESGTGKELIAEAIHERSRRNNHPFVKVNLGGISQSLFESEMFGHKRGAFTDAHHDRIGRFELADKGTIFLDEIGDLDLVCQVKLLRVLQDQSFEPLGESRTKRVDTRIISATNRNLTEMILNEAFREDLFYRINLITIRIPALRERTEDIPLLVNHFIQEQSRLNNLPPVEISSEAITYLQKLPYPGNVRELKNLVDRTLLMASNRVLTDRDFKEQQVETALSAPSYNFASSLEKTEKDTILKAIAVYGCNHSKIAAALGMSRQMLYRRMEKHGITLPE